VSFLTIDQVNIFLNSITDRHFKQLVQFYLWTGCRRTEPLELLWSDVDRKSNEVFLGQVESQTKLRRPFPITDRIDELLDELEQDRIPGCEKVFGRFTE